MSDAATIMSHATSPPAAGNVTVVASANPLAWKDHFVDYAINHAGALMTALVILVTGALVARALGRVLDAWLGRKALEPPLRVLLVRVARLLVIALTLAMALATAGMDITALIAGVSVAGVGLGLALQGVLGNLVAGMTIILTKPFRVGEYIQLLGVEGQVHTIELLTTTLVHADLSRVKIPNRKIIGEVLQNYGEMRQLDMALRVGFGTDLDAALAAAKEVLARLPKVLKEPAPYVGLAVKSDTTVAILVRPWTKVDHYWVTQSEVYLALVNEFKARNIGLAVSTLA
jgi:small conductance mechanosensitive channel